MAGKEVPLFDFKRRDGQWVVLINGVPVRSSGVHKVYMRLREKSKGDAHLLAYHELSKRKGWVEPRHLKAPKRILDDLVRMGIVKREEIACGEDRRYRYAVNR
jgi:hypothetical protein